ncbi:MAG: electron transport complex subunit RsxC [Treponema sp.]|nr:electron transport complex subunit RsxC [Treponema sp.]
MNAIRKPVARIRGGTNIPHFKNTAECESVKMPAPPLVVLPMRQHIGSPCKPTVKTGDMVAAGQTVGDSNALVSAPIHATVSGRVRAIAPFLLPDGVEVEAVHIENDGYNTLHPEIRKPKVKNREDFLHAVRQSGIVGMGGAGFPTHAKLALKKGASVDTLIINGAECEPYVTADYREIMENHANVLAGIELVMEYMGIGNCVIGVESNKPKAVSLLAEGIAKKGMKGRVSVAVLPARYPYGAEKMLVRVATGRTIPPGGLPSDVGVVVLNVSTVSALNCYLNTGMPLIHKRVTVDGRAVANPKNVIVPIGAPIRDIVDFCGGFSREPEKVIKGGPMMGAAQCDRQAPILKQDNAILCLTADETFMAKAKPCIRCGRCVQTCPMSLAPMRLDRYASGNNVKMLRKLGITSCMECGCCAYACPSKRPLVQSMRQGKQTERKGEMQKCST